MKNIQTEHLILAVLLLAAALIGQCSHQESNRKEKLLDVQRAAVERGWSAAQTICLGDGARYGAEFAQCMALR